VPPSGSGSFLERVDILLAKDDATDVASVRGRCRPEGATSL